MPTLFPCARSRSPTSINKKSIASVRGMEKEAARLRCMFVTKHTSKAGSYTAPSFFKEKKYQQIICGQLGITPH